MMKREYILFSYLLAALLLAESTKTHPPVRTYHEYIGSDNISTYTIDCDQLLVNNCTSMSLEQISNCLESGHSYNIYISSIELNLNTTVTFSDAKYLSIAGSHMATTITCQGEKFAGLIFKNLERVAITGISVKNCGAIYRMWNFRYSSAVIMVQNKDIEVEGITIANSSGIGLMIVDHQGGNIRFKFCNFFQNVLSENDTMYKNIKGGGGLYVGGFEKNHSQPIMMSFINCTYERNVAHTAFYDSLYTDDLGKPVKGFGHGGGATFFFDNGLTDIHVLVSNCTFKRNEAFKGGGLSVNIKGNLKSLTKSISVEVQSSIFEENGCDSSNFTNSGGGIHVSFATLEETNLELNNNMVIKNVQFTGNCAHFGGGLYFYSDINENTRESNTINIAECIFEGNKAHTGSAVDITPTVFERVSSGIRMIPTFRNCNFFYNIVKINTASQHENAQTTYGIATIYVSLYSIKFEGCNSFEGNVGTAIHIVNGKIDMSQSDVHFYNNSGINGGAVALIGVSLMSVGPNKEYTFVNNTALGKGGGLYVEMVDNHDVTASKTCFIEYKNGPSRFIPTREWTANISFIGNRAILGVGHAIFATTLYPCQTINNGTVDELNLISIHASEVFTQRGIRVEEVDQDKLEGTQIATEGAQFLLEKCKLQVIPGERFPHGVTIYDDLNQTTKVVLTVSIFDNPEVKLDRAFSSCVGESIILRGREGKEVSLHLQTTTSRLTYTRLKVKLMNCPPGFRFDEVQNSCVCNTEKYYALVKCNTTKFHSYITPGYWVGTIENQTELVISYCPLRFCDYDKMDTTGYAIKLPQTNSGLNKAMCGTSRNGISCGNCAQGFTSNFHSPTFACKRLDPKICKLGWFFYILSELVPVTLIFITVIALNISFTSGKVNGFILYSQLLCSFLIDGNGFITFIPNVGSLTRIYQVIYGVFNLDFFQIEYLSFCLISNASALDILVVKYITIIYALLLIFLVIWCMNRCHCITRCFARCCRITTVKSSVIHGLSAFLILCYSQCLKVSLNLLSGYRLLFSDDSNSTSSMRVTLNGNIHHFKKEHLPYAIPAIFCLMTLGMFPPLLFLVYPLLNRVLPSSDQDDSKIVKYVTRKLSVIRMKPFLDSFQGCFKDNRRFFAGLYFLYRWIPLLLDTFVWSFKKYYVALEALVIAMLVLHILYQPYAQKIHNIIDTLLFADLALINIITFAHYYVFRTRVGRQAVTHSITPSAVIQLILIYLPLIIATVYLIVVIFRLGCKRKKQSASPTSSSIVLIKLKDFMSSYRDVDEVNHDNDLLPHRLLTENVEYEYREDIDYVSNEEQLNTDYISSTY